MICSPAGAHHRRWSFVILLIAIAVAATEGPWVCAQGVLIPPDAKKANDMAQWRSAIEQKLTELVKNLADPAVDVQTKARVQLENEARIPGSKDPPSPAYLDLYTRTLNKLVDTIKTNESVRTRLNAALAVCNIAQVADNDNLKDAVQAFVQDKNPAVVLWGVKGAKFIIPAQLRAGQIAPFNPALVKAVIDAVKANTEGAIAGAIAGEAYDALTLDISNTPGALLTIAKTQPKSIPTIAPFVLDLLKARVEAYRKGVPPSPRSDAAGTRFITDGSVWAVLTPAQRHDAMQTLCNLITLAGKQAMVANKGDLRDLAYTIQRAASAISTILPADARPKLDPAVSLKETAPADQVRQAAESVTPVVKSQQVYSDLAPAPEITGHEAAPAPASAPTTGPVAIPGAGNLPPGGVTPAPPPATTAPPATRPVHTPPPPATPPRPPAGSTAHPPAAPKPPNAR